MCSKVYGSHWWIGLETSTAGGGDRKLNPKCISCWELDGTYTLAKRSPHLHIYIFHINHPIKCLVCSRL